MGCEECRNYLSELGLQEVYNRYWSKENIPLFGVLEITYHCNFRCVHCYAGDRHETPFLSRNQIISIVDELAQAGTLVLTLSGGDPLVHPDFKEIYRYIRKKGIFVEVFTNGALITPEIVALFEEYPPINVDITLYGASDDTYYKVTGSKNGYSAVVRAIDLLKEKKIHFTLKTCVICENVNDLSNIKKYAESIGIDYRYSFDIAPSIGGDNSTRQHMLSPEEIVECEKADPERAQQWSQQSLAEIDEVPYYELPIFNCKTGRFTFCVSADGNLSGCIHDRSNLVKLTPGSFIDCWKTVNQMIKEPLITPDYPCASCELLPFCNTCPADAQREFGSPTKVHAHQCALANLRYLTFAKKGGV